VVKIAWYCDVLSESRAVTEICGTEGITNKYSQTVKNVYDVSAVDNITDSCRASRIAGSKTGQVTRVALASQQQQYLRGYFNMLMNSFETTNGLQPESLQLNPQYPRKQLSTLLMP
jgi:hypothetical protein